MASKNYTKDSPEFKIFQDLYVLAKKYAIPEDSYDFWENVEKDFQSFCDKYESFDSKLAHGFATAWSGHLERIMKNGEKG